MSFVPAKKVAADDIARLQAFLTSDHLPEGTLNLAQLRGFLWAVASSPTRLGATDWMPVVWGEGEEGAEPVEIFRSAEEAQSVIPVILYLYQQAAQQAESGDLRLPACHACGASLIERRWHAVTSNRVRSGGACPDCGATIAGVFDDRSQRSSPGRRYHLL